MSSPFRAIFPTPKPILGMLHLAGPDPDARLDQALRETEMLVEGGCDGIVVENYYGEAADVPRVLDRLMQDRPSIRVGLNLLRDFRSGLALARDYDADFLQIDSVAGHLSPDEDASYAAALAEGRSAMRATLLGGVRFKYQPVRSGRDEAEDLHLGAARCDAIVVTGEATGTPTDLGKLRRFRATLGPDVPLLIGAGMTADTVGEQLAEADGAVVGSWFKTGHKAEGAMEPAHIRVFMEAVRRFRDGMESA